MNAALKEQTGIRVEGGFYVARFNLAAIEHALIVAPKTLGQQDDKWNESYDSVEGALSFNDGVANTLAMAKAGSRLAQWALDLRIDGVGGFYLPSLDEAELCYRHMKPGKDENSQWARSGINLSAVPPTYPYTLVSPGQTVIEAFRTGGSEAFDEVAYWTSTQHASDSGCAWGQGFNNGGQDRWVKVSKLRARAVRRSPI